MKLQIVIQGSDKDFNKLTRVAEIAEDLKLKVTFPRAYKRIKKQRLEKQIAKQITKIEVMFSTPEKPFSRPVTRTRFKSPLR
jgi:hypothetical protein